MFDGFSGNNILQVSDVSSFVFKLDGEVVCEVRAGTKKRNFDDAMSDNGGETDSDDSDNGPSAKVAKFSHGADDMLMQEQGQLYGPTGGKDHPQFPGPQSDDDSVNADGISMEPSNNMNMDGMGNGTWDEGNSFSSHSDEDVEIC